MNIKYLSLSILVFILVTATFCQQPGNDKITVPLSDPTRPAFLKVGILSGSIIIKGYSGKEVLVEARTGESDEDGDYEHDKDDKKRGLRRIPNISTGLTVEEEDNEVTVSTGAMNSGRKNDLYIQVPTSCSMKLSTLNDGDIKVENVTGDIEVSNLNGEVTLENISGSAVVDALNDDITVVFASVDTKKSMSFSSMNGDIDVTLPADTKAMMRLKNDMGEIYSDFEIKMDYSAPKVEDYPKDKRGKRKISMEKMMNGTINGGGGADMLLKNFNGDIFIRKGK
ncbi:MAG: hypothetical protein EPO24_12710 [Bacteroidetes bacterium]|nr:MAG: hypothetical protein EPO24_12710 [Bacteroidota bacterium]